ncbi:MAG: 4'-phosphopantetheinyl transferase family protein [Candidatus Acidiferrales bacterium]
MDAFPATLGRLQPHLSADENERASRFHFNRDRTRFIAARGALRELLGGYLRLPPGAITFHYDGHKKPSLDGKLTGKSLNFNVSHSDDVVVYAFGWDRNIGIDVEKMRQDFGGEDVARRYFSSGEVSRLMTLDQRDRSLGFFNCWTRKEAYVKACGEGLEIPLDSFEVSLEPGKLGRFLGGVDDKWHLAAFDVDEFSPGAVVYDGSPCDLRFLSRSNVP